ERARGEASLEGDGQFSGSLELRFTTGAAAATAGRAQEDRRELAVSARYRFPLLLPHLCLLLRLTSALRRLPPGKTSALAEPQHAKRLVTQGETHVLAELHR